MDNLSDILKEQGRTKTWLSKQIGKHRITVQGYCGGAIVAPYKVMKEIAELLSVKVEDL